MSTPPLGSYVVLTRSPSGNHSWDTVLTEMGLQTYSLPGIETRSSDLSSDISSVLAQLGQYDWVVFTSTAGVRHTLALLDQPNREAPDWPPIAVIGDETAAAARQAGLAVAFQPSTASSAALAVELSPVDQQKILLLRANIASAELPTTLQQRGAKVTDISVYQTHLRTETDPAFSHLLRSRQIRCLTFASPSAVEGFTQRLTPAEQDTARRLPAIALGPSVTEALAEAGFSYVSTAAEPTVGSVAAAILSLSDPI